MTDIERAAFIERERAAFEAFHRAEGWTDNMLIRMENGEYQRNLQNRFIGWQARASRPVVVTDEMALQGAWAPINEFAQRLGLSPFDPRMAPDINEIERVRLILSAALNGGM